MDWITVLRAPAIRQLVEADVIQLSLFDERDLAKIQSPDYPDERLIVCKNPVMAARSIAHIVTRIAFYEMIGCAVRPFACHPSIGYYHDSYDDKIGLGDIR